jgi:hypothetical protein
MSVAKYLNYETALIITDTQKCPANSAKQLYIIAQKMSSSHATHSSYLFGKDLLQEPICLATMYQANIRDVKSKCGESTDIIRISSAECYRSER